MNKNMLVIASIMLSLPALAKAEESDLKNIQCRDLAITKYKQPQLFKVSGTKKLPFAKIDSTGNDTRYLVEGDVVISQGEKGGKACAVYQGSKGFNIGWLDKKNLSTATEAERIAKLPKNRADLFVNGYPIHPSCIYIIGDSDYKNVNECQKASKAELALVDIEEPNSIAYSKETKEKDYSYYEFASTNYLGRRAGEDIFDSAYDGGGTGKFTDVSAFKTANGSLKRAASFAGGDRANGGVMDAKIVNGKVQYSIALTAFDLYDIAGGNKTKKLEAYDDLDACAACYTASATFAENKLLYVELDKDYQAYDNPNSKYQTQFDKVLLSYIKAGKLRLNQAELKKLASDFVKTIKP